MCALVLGPSAPLCAQDTTPVRGLQVRMLPPPYQGAWLRREASNRPRASAACSLPSPRGCYRRSASRPRSDQAFGASDVVLPTAIVASKARISDACETEILDPSFVGRGKRPLRTPAHQRDLPIGSTGKI